MRLVIFDVVIGGQRAVKVAGQVDHDEMLAAIGALISGHVQSLINIGIPRQIAVDRTYRDVTKLISSAPSINAGFVMTEKKKRR